MQLSPVVDFKDEDLQKYAAMKAVIKQGDFKIRGDAVIMAASLFAWFEGIEFKIKHSIEESKKVGAPKIKENAKKSE